MLYILLLSIPVSLLSTGVILSTVFVCLFKRGAIEEYKHLNRKL